MTDATCDEAAEQVLRMPGLPVDEARRVATALLPGAPAVDRV